MCAQLYSNQLRETMDDEWKEWDVVGTVCTTEIPGFMAPTGGAATLLEAARQLIQDEWKEFVDLLNADGHGAGYERLLTLRDNMEARKDELSKEVEKWEDRANWLRRLKGRYVNKLQRLADVSNPETLWRTTGVNDPIEQLDCADDLPADQPIAETFLDFDDEGHLAEEPNLKRGWQAYVNNIPIGSGIHDLIQEDKLTDAPEPRRENVTVHYRLLDKELEKAGIVPANIDSQRPAINMRPSTTWRDALLQIEEQEQSVREGKFRPKKTIKVLDFRLRILENVLYRFETFGTVEGLNDSDARDAARKATEDLSTPTGWEKNAAMMHAYFSNNGTPENIGDVDEVIAEEGLLDSFSHDHTWRTLKEEGWASSKGNIQALVEALERWAEHFEDEYGKEKADWAADPFNWPSNPD